MKNLFRLKKNESDGHKCTVKHRESKSFLPPRSVEDGFFQSWRRSFKKSTLISEHNPQSTEYFRSMAEILRIRKDHVMSKSCIIHPFSTFRAFYEMWMSVVLIVAMFYMPADSAFHLNEHEESDNDDFEKELHFEPFQPFNFLIHVICMVDILMTFLTGYPVKRRRKVVMKPSKIAKHYILSIYFVSDLLSAIPEPFFIKNRNTQRLVNALGFLKIIRLPTLFFYASRSAEILGIRSVTIQVVKNFLITYIVFHWFACIHYMVPQIRYFMYGEVLAESWIIKADLLELDFVSKYIGCLYRVAGCIFCITFEESQVVVWEEKMMEIVTFIFGKVFVFYITVLFMHQLFNQRSLEIKYFETISQVKAYMSQKHLPMHMQLKLLQFYDYKYNKKFFQERNISSLLSDKLKGEINLNVCSKLVQSVALLAHLPQESLKQVVTYLKAEIYLPNDIIIKSGSVGDCMYFLASGTVAVWTPSGKEVCHLQDGAYFGEISLMIKDKRRTANIVAIEICEVYKLDRRAFKNCFKGNLELLKMLEDVAIERLEITQMFEDVHVKAFLEK
ncbi:cNMP binding domain containing protein [Asbolus verrucosus]|uniref:cNMP binding domain containing protein n=1 Tax=Asbolus verrucosus TaxID=1661398 RepID=A0A482VYY6_ASBVE|nr:cNMP binding domain containing protein [Asbolus verrucosus]